MPYGAGVKGKQVQILYEPVTVVGECSAKMPLRFLGKAADMTTLKSGNLPCAPANADLWCYYADLMHGKRDTEDSASVAVFCVP